MAFFRAIQCEPITKHNQRHADSGNHIQIKQTVTGTLYGTEAGVWIFRDGPAYVTILLDAMQFGSALLIVRDPSGVDQAYVDEQSPGVAR